MSLKSNITVFYISLCFSVFSFIRFFFHSYFHLGLIKFSSPFLILCQRFLPLFTAFDLRYICAVHVIRNGYSILQALYSASHLRKRFNYSSTRISYKTNLLRALSLLSAIRYAHAETKYPVEIRHCLKLQNLKNAPKLI